MIYEFAATQDLHGYSKPWAPGVGKNLWPTIPEGTQTTYGVTWTVNADGTITVSGTATGASTFTAPNIPVSADLGIVTISGILGTTNIAWSSIKAVDGEGTTVATISGGAPNASFTVDLAEYPTVAAILASFKRNNNTTVSGTIKPQLEKGSERTDFVPYSNICPPEGFNIWDPSQDKMIQVYAGYVNSNTRELYLRPVYKEYAGEELVGPWMSSLDEYSEDATPTEGAFVIDFGGELTSYEITPFMLQTLLDSLGIRQHFTDGAGLLNKLLDQAQGRVRSEEELLHLSRPLKVIAIGDQLPSGITFKPISKDVLPGLPGKFIR